MEAERTLALLSEIPPQDEIPRKMEPNFGSKTQDRLRIILNSIANVLVSSKAEGEVITVGLQHQKDKLTLTLASINDVPQVTADHAKNLVADIQKFGRAFAEWRTEQENTDEALDPDRSPSPT